MTHSTASETCPSECDPSSHHQTVMPSKYSPGRFQNLPWSRGIQASLSQELVTVKVILGLKKAHFAMPPRWLKPVDRIESNYFTITFAISDPDGTVTSRLLMGRAALSGKKVTIQR
jgi:hypothetical protein